MLRVHDKDWPFFQLLMLNILPGPDINFPQLLPWACFSTIHPSIISLISSLICPRRLNSSSHIASLCTSPVRLLAVGMPAHICSFLGQRDNLKKNPTIQTIFIVILIAQTIVGFRCFSSLAPYLNGTAGRPCKLC